MYTILSFSLILFYVFYLTMWFRMIVLTILNHIAIVVDIRFDEITKLGHKGAGLTLVHIERNGRKPIK